MIDILKPLISKFLPFAQERMGFDKPPRLFLKNDNSKLVSNNIEEQTHQVMKNLIDVLKGCRSSLDKVIFARVYLVNFKDFDKMNKVYSSYFKKDKLPARTCIGVTGLAVGALVEIDFIAGK